MLVQKLCSRLTISSYSAKAALLLVAFVAVGIGAMALLGFHQLRNATALNAEIRIYRAARATALVFDRTLPGTFTFTRDGAGLPQVMQVTRGNGHDLLQPSAIFDGLAEDIGRMNKGAVNIFRFDQGRSAFERIATNLRGPNGEYVRRVYLGAQHPAFATLMKIERYVGNSPINGRMRLAYLMPILGAQSEPVGALAVDVGWVDELWRSAEELRERVSFWSAGLLFLVAALGWLTFHVWMRPLRLIAEYAADVARQADVGAVPCLGRRDEIGRLASGMEKVVEMRGRLQDLAYRDPVSGLANRAYFQELLASRLDSASSESTSMALLILGIDNFRAVNDAFGHADGDRLLAIVANRFSTSLPDEVAIARLSADEFAVLCPRCRLAEHADALAEALTGLFSSTIELPNGDIVTSASIGIAMLPEQGRDAATALRNASLALHKAKARGRRQSCHFEPSLIGEAEDKLQLAGDLRLAIERREITLQVQLQISPRDLRLQGVEVLARWSHPQRGNIPPNIFVALAEEHGIIAELGRCVLDEACRTARAWRDAGFDFKRISVNVSPTELWQPDYDQMVAETLSKHDLAPQSLCIELTEAVFLNHAAKQVLAVLDRLGKMGIHLSIDDFGTGYSSLGYLQKIAFNELKIDRAFIKDVDQNPERQKLLAGIVGLGRGLGLEIVAEGTETAAEVAVVTELGCDSVQGYFFCKPVVPLLAPIEFERIRREHRHASHPAVEKQAS